MGIMDVDKLLSLLAVAVQASALMTSPPLIVQQPTAEELLFIVTPVIKLKYRWTKNGEPFNYATYGDRISQQPGRGTLIFTVPKDEDVGQYQCFAYNEWGIATSNSVFVRKSELQSFKDTDNDVDITAEEGYPYKLTCQPPHGYPKPLVLWVLINIDQGTLKTANNSRITCDPEGNLWFSNVTRKDSIETTNFAYICAVKSFSRWEYKLGNKVFLTVTHTSGSETLNRSPPVKQYTTKSHEVALRGKNVELYCRYIWWNINYGKTLVINPVTYEDEGAYTCEASNGVGSAQSHSINLSVEASPSFNEAPESQTLGENETAVIRCKADGYPAPQIKWTYNGEPIERAAPNPRRSVTADSITITNLTKKDTGNYGCNATNFFGYVYKDVYINVQSAELAIINATERPCSNQTDCKPPNVSKLTVSPSVNIKIKAVFKPN